MAPLRRYLRITKYSVLECRIYVDNPALVPSWLLHPRDPVLPRVIESVRPLVLPKLMEERERAKKKGTKKKGAIRDVLVEDDFEVALFLTETNTRHSLLYKHRRARDKTQTRLTSNSARLTGAGSGTGGTSGTSGAPIDVDDGSGSGGRLRVEMPLQDASHDRDDGRDIVLMPEAVGASVSAALPPPPPPPNLLVEDSEDEEDTLALQDIPDVHAAVQKQTAEASTRRPKRRRQPPAQAGDSDEEQGPAFEESDDDNVDDDDDDDDNNNNSLFGSDGGGSDVAEIRPPKRSRVGPAAGAGAAAGGVDADADADADEADDEAGRDKKKKLAMDVIYEGFAIYGRVLCLVVKQRGGAARGRATAQPAAAGKPSGQASMENWIASTQLLPGAAEADTAPGVG